MSGKSSATSWSLMLMATLLFGVGLGFSLGRAVYLPREATAPTAQQAVVPPAEPVNAPAPAALPQSTPETQATAPQESPVVPASLPPPADAYWGARHLFIAVNGQWLADATKAMLRQVRPGGVLLHEANLGSRTQTFALVKEIKTATGLGEGLGDLPLIAVGQEGGSLNVLGVEDAPSAQALGENGDPELARSVGQRYGEECIGRGIAIVFAPVLDVYEPGGINPGFAVRAFGTEHTQVARMALAMADGLRQGGVLPVAKHFPGYGAATYGSDGLLVALNKDAAGLGRLLYPFDQAVRRGVPGMLVAHVAVPALDPEDPRRSAALSPVLVSELLRARWGYDGVIVADDVAMNSMTRSLGAEQAAVQALAAGCDAVVMIDPDPARIRSVNAAIAKAVEDGTLSREKLQQSVARLDRWQQAIGNLNPIKPSAELDRVAASVPPPVIETTPLPDAPPPRNQEPEQSKPEEAASATAVQTAPPPVVMEATPADTVSAPTETAPAPPAEEDGKSRIEHTVREGEDLVAIAQVYSVSVDDLVRWNALATPMAGPGTKLTVFLDDAAQATPPPAPEDVATPVSEPVPADTPPVAAVETPPLATADPAPADAGTLGAKLVYMVAEGDTLDAIVAKYHVAKDDIMRWNGLESESVTAGRTLTLFLGGGAPETPTESSDVESAPEPAPEPSSAEPSPAESAPAAAAETAAPAPAPKVEEAMSPPDIPTETYVIHAGDTITKISKQFGTTHELLLQLNGLKDADAILVGQVLKVPKTESAPAPTPATP